ncbi:hypothetical protein [Cohnella panacarvi]|uniref:hypothetical protein n=1 Tax=Cohnella panacarvi TaxID=400776 RepID=UPI00047E558E|nr:hypothetical protein [Cohnella panacarvi]
MGACRHHHRRDCGCNRRKRKLRRRRRTCPPDNTGAQEEEQTPSPVQEEPSAYWAPLWIERIPDWAFGPIGGGISPGHHHSGGFHGDHHRTGGAQGLHHSGQPHEHDRPGVSPGWL